MTKTKIFISLYIIPFLMVLFAIIYPLADVSFVFELLAFVLLIATEFTAAAFHFWIVAHFLKKKAIKKITAVVAVLSYFVAVITEYSILHLVQGHWAESRYLGKIATHTVYGLLFLMVIMSAVMLAGSLHKGFIYKLVLTAEAVVLIIANAFLTIVLLDCVSGVEELELLIRTFMLIVLFSCLLGLLMTRHLAVVKLSLWFVGIAASTFVYMYLSGSPNKSPICDPFSAARWLISTIIPFVGCLLCFLLKKDTLEKNGLVID